MKGFYHIWTWRQSWSCDPDAANKLSFPLPKELDALADRRRVRKLTLMYKIVSNDVPSYLLDLLPNRVNETNIYSLRNNTDFVIPFSRLCSYESSFFPPTLK